jgi:hypothetical protein
MILFLNVWFRLFVSFKGNLFTGEGYLPLCSCQSTKKIGRLYNAKHFILFLKQPNPQLFDNVHAVPSPSPLYRDFTGPFKNSTIVVCGSTLKLSTKRQHLSLKWLINT